MSRDYHQFVCALQNTITAAFFKNLSWSEKRRDISKKKKKKKRTKESDENIPLWHKLHLTGQTTDWDLKTNHPINSILLREGERDCNLLIIGLRMGHSDTFVVVSCTHISVSELLILPPVFKSRHVQTSKWKESTGTTIDVSNALHSAQVHEVMCCWLFQ